MSKSEEIKKEIEREENDIKILSLSTKLIREERNERFEKEYLGKIKEKYIVTYDDNHKYTICSSKGMIDYFPKKNKLLIRKKNKWIKPALKWIINNLIKE